MYIAFDPEHDLSISSDARYLAARAAVDAAEEDEWETAASSRKVDDARAELVRVVEAYGSLLLDAAKTRGYRAIVTGDDLEAENWVKRNGPGYNDQYQELFYRIDDAYQECEDEAGAIWDGRA